MTRNAKTTKIIVDKDLPLEPPASLLNFFDRIIALKKRRDRADPFRQRRTVLSVQTWDGRELMAVVSPDSAE